MSLDSCTPHAIPCVKLKSINKVQISLNNAVTLKNEWHCVLFEHDFSFTSSALLCPQPVIILLIILREMAERK